jgi:hypothetical protein
MIHLIRKFIWHYHESVIDQIGEGHRSNVPCLIVIVCKRRHIVPWWLHLLNFTWRSNPSDVQRIAMTTVRWPQSFVLGVVISLDKNCSYTDRQTFVRASSFLIRRSANCVCVCVCVFVCLFVKQTLMIKWILAKLVYVQYGCTFWV